MSRILSIEQPKLLFRNQADVDLYEASLTSSNNGFFYNNESLRRTKYLISKYGYSSDVADYVDRVFIGYNTKKLIRFAFVNAYLLDSENRTLGEFLEDKHDQILSRLLFGDLDTHSKTDEVFSYYNELLEGKESPKSYNQKIETLTKEQILGYLEMPNEFRAGPFKTIQSVDTALTHIAKRHQVKAINPYSAKNKAVSFFANALSERSDVSFDSVLVMKNFTSFMEEMRVVDNTGTSGTLYSGDFEEYVSYLIKYKDKFGPAEAFFALYPLTNPKAFCRVGDVSEIVEFFLKVIEKQGEHAVDFFTMVGDLGLSSSVELPTMNQWRKALDDDLLEGAFSSEIVVSLVHGAGKDNVKVSERLKNYREAFEGYGE